jgi:hypothetical protein
MFHPIIGDTYNIQSKIFFIHLRSFKEKKTHPQVVGFYKGRSILAFWTFYISLLLENYENGGDFLIVIIIIIYYYYH